MIWFCVKLYPDEIGMLIHGVELAIQEIEDAMESEPTARERRQLVRLSRLLKRLRKHPLT